MQETFYETELSCAATFRNVLGQVIKRARGLLFYRASETFKEDGILRRWKVSRIQTTVSEDLSFPGSGPIVLHRSFGTCALVIIPPL